MTGSNIRDEVLTQHAALKAVLHYVGYVAGSALAGDRSAREELPGIARAMVAEVSGQLNEEEELVIPALAARPFGETLAEGYRQEHEAEREMLETFHGYILKDDEPKRLATSVQAMTRVLIADLDAEEREFLDSGLLSDDLEPIQGAEAP